MSSRHENAWAGQPNPAGKTVGNERGGIPMKDIVQTKALIRRAVLATAAAESLS